MGQSQSNTLVSINTNDVFRLIPLDIDIGKEDRDI